jgi:glycosyltransferase involved in cell wall biosynthesis
MKLVMIGPYPEPGRIVSGGVERVIDTLLPELRGQVALTLVVPGASRDAECDQHGVRTIYLRRGSGPGALAYWNADARRVARLVETLKPDLVHLQGVAGVGRLISAPRILTVHGIGHRDFVTSRNGAAWSRAVRHGMAQVMRTVEASARRRIGNVIVINPYAVEALRDIGNLTQFPIPNPIDRVFCGALPRGSQQHPRRIVSVGRIGRRKNTSHAVLLAARLLQGDETAAYAALGPADDEVHLQECKAIAARNGMAGRIEFRGGISSEKLRSELDHSSVMLMTSRQETAPVAIAEAHARGVAVVAPQAFGIKHMINPGRNGFFLPDGDIEAQLSVLRRALDHDWDRARIAAEAQAIYAPRRIAQLTYAAYRAVLGRDRQHGESFPGAERPELEPIMAGEQAALQ